MAAGYAVCTKPAFAISRATIVMRAVMMMKTAHRDTAPATGWLMPGTIPHALLAFDPAIAMTQVLCPQGGLADEITRAWGSSNLPECIQPGGGGTWHCLLRICRLKSQCVLPRPRFWPQGHRHGPVVCDIR